MAKMVAPLLSPLDTICHERSVLVRKATQCALGAQQVLDKYLCINEFSLQVECLLPPILQKREPQSGGYRPLVPC